jgi:hypothetical protein
MVVFLANKYTIFTCSKSLDDDKEKGMYEYLIAYDLVNHNSYNRICGAISGLDMESWPFLHSTWIAHSDLSAEQIATCLRKYICKEDKLFVVQLAGDWSSAGLPKFSSEWLEKNLH